LWLAGETSKPVVLTAKKKKTAEIALADELYGTSAKLEIAGAVTPGGKGLVVFLQ